MDGWRERLKTSRSLVVGVPGGEKVENQVHEGGRMTKPKFMAMAKGLFKIEKSTSNLFLPYPQYTVNV